MCGIIGIASRGPLVTVNGWTAAAQRWRIAGPDDNGFGGQQSEMLALPNAGWPIIDLSPGGHQPMHR